MDHSSQPTLGFGLFFAVSLLQALSGSGPLSIIGGMLGNPGQVC